MSKGMAKLWRRIVCSIFTVVFVVSMVVPPAYAQILPRLPLPGEIVGFSDSFRPAVLQGMIVHPEDPLLFDFIVDHGQTDLTGQLLTDETTKLVKYFLAGMAVPEKEMWVNLSPLEKDRIMPDALSRTDVGREMLEQDYVLKQVMASLLYPEKDIGRKFWDEIYQRAYAEFGMVNVPVDTFNKVWIIPEQASVYVDGNKVFITQARLKVMLDNDYAAQRGIPSDSAAEETSGLARDVLRSVILPVLQKEVNEGKNFSALRQVFHSMILAGWYKNALKESLLTQAYADSNKVTGIEIAEKHAKQRVYAQYMAAYQKGVYNYIKEEFDRNTKEILPRKYFSGGISDLVVQPTIDFASASASEDEADAYFLSGRRSINSYRFVAASNGLNTVAPPPQSQPALNQSFVPTAPLAQLRATNELVLVIRLLGADSVRIGLAGEIEGVLRISEAADLPVYGLDQTSYEQATQQVETVVLRYLADNKIELSTLVAVCANAGSLPPNNGGLIWVNPPNDSHSGEWELDDELRADLTRGAIFDPSNIGAFLADSIAKKVGRKGVPAYILDPNAIEQMRLGVTLTGLSGEVRTGDINVLDVVGAARTVASFSRPHAGLVVINIKPDGNEGAAVQDGRVIDATTPGDAPWGFRGGYPTNGRILNLAEQQRRRGLSTQQIRSLLLERGGAVSYLGTGNIDEIIAMIQEAKEIAGGRIFTISEDDLKFLLNANPVDVKTRYQYLVRLLAPVAERQGMRYKERKDLEKVLEKVIKGRVAHKVLEAMSLNIAKTVAALAMSFRGEMGGVVLTGDGAKSEFLVDLIKQSLRNSPLEHFPVHVLPGSMALWSMARTAFGVFDKPLKYQRYAKVLSFAKPVDDDPFEVYRGVDLRPPAPNKVYSNIRTRADMMRVASKLGRRNLVIPVPNELSIGALQLAAENGLLQEVYLVGGSEEISTLLARYRLKFNYRIIPLEQEVNESKKEYWRRCSRAAARLVKDGTAFMAMKGLMSTDIFLNALFAEKLQTGRVSWVNLVQSRYDPRTLREGDLDLDVLRPLLEGERPSDIYFRYKLEASGLSWGAIQESAFFQVFNDERNNRNFYLEAQVSVDNPLLDEKTAALLRRAYEEGTSLTDQDLNRLNMGLFKVLYPKVFRPRLYYLTDAAVNDAQTDPPTMVAMIRNGIAVAEVFGGRNTTHVGLLNSSDVATGEANDSLLQQKAAKLNFGVEIVAPIGLDSALDFIVADIKGLPSPAGDVDVVVSGQIAAANAVYKIETDDGHVEGSLLVGVPAVLYSRGDGPQEKCAALAASFVFWDATHPQEVQADKSQVRGKDLGGIDLGTGNYLKVIARDGNGVPKFDPTQLRQLRKDLPGFIPVPVGLPQPVNPYILMQKVENRRLPTMFTRKQNVLYSKTHSQGNDCFCLTRKAFVQRWAIEPEVAGV